MTTIRQATLADKAAIFDFLRIAYARGSEYKFPDRWEWAFERNPFVEGLPIWIAIAEGGRVVGQSCALVEPLVVNGRELRVGWGVDFYVLPEFRGQGIGTKLQVANDAAHEIFMSLDMACSAARIKSGLGFQPLSPVPVFQKILRREPKMVLRTLAVRTRLPVGLLRALGAHRLATGWLNFWGARRDWGQGLPGEGSVSPVDSFGSEFDALWSRLSGKFSGLIRRDCEYLRWKFACQPYMRYETLVARRNEELCGYVTLRRAWPPEGDAGIIADLFADPQDEAVIYALLRCAVRRLQEQRAACVIAASSVAAYQRCLLDLGFKENGAGRPMVRAGVDVPHEGWLLGKGDHDWDQYMLANRYVLSALTHQSTYRFSD